MFAASSPIAASLVDWISWARARLSSAICCLTPSERREFSAATAARNAIPSASRSSSVVKRAASVSQATAERAEAPPAPASGGRSRAHRQQGVGMAEALLGLLVEPRVPDRGRRRRRRGLAKGDLVGGERVRLAVPERQDADELVLEEEREAEERDESLAPEPVEVCHAGTREHVAQSQGRPVLHDPADQALVVGAPEPRALLRRPRRAVLRVDS